MVLLGVAHHLVDGCPSSPSAACALNIPYANSWTQTTIACHTGLQESIYPEKFNQQSHQIRLKRSCWVPELAKQIVGPRRFHPHRWIQDHYVQNISKYIKTGHTAAFRVQISDPEMAQTFAYSDQDCGRSQGFDLPRLLATILSINPPQGAFVQHPGCVLTWEPHAAHVSTLHSYALHQLGDEVTALHRVLASLGKNFSALGCTPVLGSMNLVGHKRKN